MQPGQRSDRHCSLSLSIKAQHCLSRLNGLEAQTSSHAIAETADRHSPYLSDFGIVSEQPSTEIAQQRQTKKRNGPFEAAPGAINKFDVEGSGLLQRQEITGTPAETADLMFTAAKPAAAIRIAMEMDTRTQLTPERETRTRYGTEELLSSQKRRHHPRSVSADRTRYKSACVCDSADVGFDA